MSDDNELLQRIGALESSLASAKAEMERYREGLLPFALTANQADHLDDNAVSAFLVRVGELRRARALLEPAPSAASCPPISPGRG
jgi:hypothetical protein